MRLEPSWKILKCVLVSVAWRALAGDAHAGGSENLLSKCYTLSLFILLIGAFVSLIQIYLNGLEGLDVVKLFRLFLSGWG